MPKSVPADIPEPLRGNQEMWESREHARPYTQVRGGTCSANSDMVKRLAEELQAVKRGVIVCGPQMDPAFPSALARLAERLGYPILADPLSQTRCGKHDRSLVVDTYDAFLRSKEADGSLKPELIIRFGATPTSKTLQNYISQHNKARQLLVHESDWQDPMHTATDMIQADVTKFADDLTAEIKSSPDRKWAYQWKAIAEVVRETIHKELQKIDEMFEGRIFAELATLLPQEATVFAGNSMPVRDLDSFFPTLPKQIRFLANRGASGIDGVLSTALGASSVSQEPTVLVLGDLSFYHDMNGLLAAKQFPSNITIIILNNNGGGIFSFLPQRDHPESFEKYFGTPHGLTFQSAASLYGLDYSKATSWDNFRNLARTGTGTKIVEVQTDRERNFQLHRQICEAVERAVHREVSGRT